MNLITDEKRVITKVTIELTLEEASLLHFITGNLILNDVKESAESMGRNPPKGWIYRWRLMDIYGRLDTAGIKSE